MHPQAISHALWQLLKRLDPLQALRGAYLGGGTALALQLGHRRSEDLDFFVPELFDIPALLVELGKGASTLAVLNQTPRHTEMLIDSLKVDVILDQVSLSRSTKPIHPEISSLRMADAVDIGRMKLVAIGSRGRRKDFVDIFCLTRATIPLRSLIALSIEENRGVKYSKLLFLKGLVDFEAADAEPDPSMIWDVAWNRIKETLRKEVKEIAAELC